MKMPKSLRVGMSWKQRMTLCEYQTQHPLPPNEEAGLTTHKLLTVWQTGKCVKNYNPAYDALANRLLAWKAGVG